MNPNKKPSAFTRRVLSFGPIPVNNEQYDSLLSHRIGGLRLLRSPTWLAGDAPRRRKAIVDHLVSIQERLHMAIRARRFQP